MEEVFFKMFESLPRQGPGSDEATASAFGKLTGLPERPDILDIGCGTGAQTLALARLTQGHITAIDNHAPFIDTLKQKVVAAGLEDRVDARVGDMGAMDFAGKRFAVIWAEGSAYSIGFTHALEAWNAFLKPGGYLVVSELVWFSEQAPHEVRDYFAAMYPDMRYFEAIFPIIEASGYELVDYFPLPAQAWRTNYYGPAEVRLTELRREYPNDDQATAVLDSFQLEIDMYRRFSEYYGYGFYIMRKVTEFATHGPLTADN
jgi:SAM-dependent methyltransferase